MGLGLVTVGDLVWEEWKNGMCERLTCVVVGHVAGVGGGDAEEEEQEGEDYLFHNCTWLMSSSAEFSSIE